MVVKRKTVKSNLSTITIMNVTSVEKGIVDHILIETKDKNYLFPNDKNYYFEIIK